MEMQYVYIISVFIVIVVTVQTATILKLLGKPKNSDEQIIQESRALRAELENKLDRLKDSLIIIINEFRKEQQDSLEKIRVTVDEKFGAIQNSNEKKLDEMRNVVNEKLEKTLETRLQKSFETVSLQLENVNKGLGEMRTVAESVGSLNRILLNSKTRGILGELQLGQIIEDIIPSHLYDKEVPTVKGSSERVEYAIKYQVSVEGEYVYLPIDSKFPLEDYYRLLDGYEAGDLTIVESSRKALLARIKTFAKDVKSKYISPPETTNFAVIFLPTEGLYAEVARDAAFFETLRRETSIIITGPTTLSAMLNSFQIGFKTLQIQKSAADIEKRLGVAKKEFETFEVVLNKAHKKITEAGNEIENLVGTRTRAINRSLRGVETYAGEDVPGLLGVSDEE